VAGEVGRAGGQRSAAVVVEHLECLQGGPVPAAEERRAGIRAGQEGRPPRDERGDLRPGVMARQKKDQMIGSQTAALRDHAGRLGADLPGEWVFEDEGHSGATLVRPALEALGDLIAQGCVDVVLC
jgi:hypothetical protein